MNSKIADVVQSPQRVSALRELGLLDTPSEQAFDRLAKLASKILHAPVALVSLVDSHRQFFKSCIGLPEPWSRWRETPLSHSFCQHVVASGQPLVIPDARCDTTLRDNLAIRDLNVIAYLGSPLILPGGQVIGSFCVIDSKPRAWTDSEIDIVRELAASVMTEIELRHARAGFERRLQERAAEFLETNESLRESESRYRELIELAADGIFISDAGGRFIDVNAAGCTLSGYTREEVLRLGMGDLIPEADRVADPPQLNELNAGKTIIRERRILRKDGTIVPVEVSAKQLPNGRLQGIVRDITRRKATEDSLRVSRERLQVLIESAPLAILAVDVAGHILSWSRGAERMFGWSEVEVIGRVCPTVPAEGVEDYLGMIGRVMRGEAVSGLVRYREKKDGIRIRASLNSAPIRDGTGEATGAIILLEDITAREYAENALRDSEEKYRTIFEQATDGILISGAKGNFLDANTAVCQMLGYPHDELLRLGSADIIVPEEVARIVPEITRLQDGHVVQSEWRVRCRDGSIRIVDVDAKQLTDGRLQAFLRDITERKQAEAEREKLLNELTARNIEMENFVYTISHDLKSPLITIGGFSTLLGKDIVKGDGAAVSDSLTEIQKAVAQMQTHIGDLLLLSRTGRASYRKTDVALSMLLDDVIGRFGIRIKAEGARLIVAPGLPTIQVDRKGFVRVFTNLIDNALKYRRPKVAPRIEIGWRQEGKELRLFVRDNGQGIKQEYQERIFGLFQRADSSTEGTGVGLAISKRVIEVHGGRIWVDSKPGQGSTFWIGLPASVIVNT